jgi:D-alanine transaminase
MLAWLNGELVPEERAQVSVLDRGFLFGDGVYELVRYFGGHGVALDLHVARLARSLELARIDGFDATRLGAIARELMRANGLSDASVYLQVTRGAGATRSHMPQPGLAPTVVALASATPALDAFTAPDALRAIVRPDLRWHRCEIKTVSLAGNILSLLEAQAAGADECILVRDGLVGEGAYTNVAAVLGGTLVTCPLGDGAAPVLHGTMRCWMLESAREAGMRHEVRRVREDELRAADEVLVQSSRRLVAGVVELDGRRVGDGAPGPACRALFAAMRARIEREVAAARG